MKLALFTALIPFCLSGQTIIETGVITGATATAAGASGKSAANALGKIFGTVDKTLKNVETVKAVPAAVAAPAAEKPKEPVRLPDVAQIAMGMNREELLTKFGDPSQKMTIPEGSHMTERYRYDVGQDWVKVILEDGKVKEVLASPRPVPLPEKP